jgi:DivIVA domain-containing protein
MAEDRTISISSSGQLGPEEVARKTFATARRGFDPIEVRAFLEEVSRALTAGQEREEEMRKEVADAEHRAAHPVLDDETLTTALGQETGRVLKVAHDAAHEVLKKAETESAEIMARAEQRESQVRADAERTAAEQATALQEERDRIHHQAEQEASVRLENARREAEDLVESTRTECRSMVQQAQELRTKVLTDLSNRRRVLHLQIEQLRAGRERLSEAIQEVRLSVDHIADDLLRAEDEARLAAEAAGRSAAGRPDPDLEVELESVAVAPAIGSGEPAQAPDPEPAAVESAPTQAIEAPTASSDAGPADEEELEESPVREQHLEDLFKRLRASGIGEAKSTEGSGDGVALGEAKALDAELSDAESTEEEGPGGPAERSIELQRKDELLKPVISGLSRRVKRALQDDQNGMLDRIRSQGGWKDDVLPDPPVHLERYVNAAGEMLAEASRAGSTFAGSTADAAADVSEITSALAEELVGPLRRRLEQISPSVDPTDEAAVVEHVGAAFREWRGDKTERLSGDHATAAFSVAVLAAAGKDVIVRWVVDDEGAPCADCEDNALADDVKPGDAFPTGHHHPPVHSGCRCLLVLPATT